MVRPHLRKEGRWIRTTSTRRATSHNEFNLEVTVAVLRDPREPDCPAQGLPNSWVTATEGESTWSPYDVIGHLIHGERTDWIPRAHYILAGENGPFEAFDRTAQLENQGTGLGELYPSILRDRV
jgi:hypothetical protein